MDVHAAIGSNSFKTTIVDVVIFSKRQNPDLTQKSHANDM
jgi:hypothetical protein